MRTVNDFKAAISHAFLRPEPGYGGNVFPAARLYSGIVLRDEAMAYQKAIEELLQSDDDEIRNLTVNLCLGFFTFYDAIPRPVFEEVRHGSR